MKLSSMIAVMTLGPCCASSAHADVFARAFMHLRGMGEDKNGDGYYDSGELVSAVGPVSFYYTGLNHDLDRFAWKSETAFIPARNVSRTMTYLDMAHPIETTPEGAKTFCGSSFYVVPGSLPGPDAVGSHYAFHLRIKPAAEQLSDYRSDRKTVLFNYGCSWGTKGLMLLMMSDQLFITCGSVSGRGTGIYLSRGEWNDIAISADNDKVRYVVQAGLAPSEAKAKYASGEFSVTAGSPTASTSSDGGKRILIGSEDTIWFAATESSEVFTSAASTVFSGGLQEFAMWTNSLSLAELREAVNFPRTDLMRVGLENDKTVEFVGTGDGPFAVESEGQWKLPEAIAAGQSVQVTFPLDGNDTYTGHPTAGTVYLSCETQLNQVLRWKATSDSGSGAVTATLNGNDLGSRDVLPGKTAYWDVPASCLAAGSNVLVVRRSDAGTDSLKLDALILGGSVQLGQKNNSMNEFVSESYAYSRDNDLRSGNLRLVARSFVGTSGSYVQSTFRVDEPDAELRQARHYFEISILANKAGEKAEMFFNDVSLGVRDLSSGKYTTCVWDVAPSAIRARDNVIRIEAPTTSWMGIDHVAWYLKRLARGSVLIVR